MTWFILLLGLVQLISATQSSLREDDALKNGIGHRLPRDVWPSRYDITLTPYLETSNSSRFTFSANVKITFRTISNTTDFIILHAKEFRHNGKPTLSPDDVSVINDMSHSNYESRKITFNTTLSPMIDYTLTYVYTANIRSDMTGFYRSSYEQNGELKWLAFTQLQPVYARRVFPCFDEPEFKAIFALTIVCPQGLTCRSNTRATVNATTNVHVFEPTPIMSTYLLAFMVSEFVPARSDNVTTILARPDVRNQGEYAFQASIDITREMNEYTGIDYFTQHSNGSIPMKMDHAAIPDLKPFAMENWGLIAYSEYNLMIDDTESSTVSKQRVTSLITHEITHMWFGNLVTCHWWSDAWLNEGFANFFQYYSMHAVRPSFRMNDQFIIDQVHIALAADISNNSKPLTNPNVNSPAEILGHFDTISYQKAASIIRMIQHWLGEETFRRGLNYHLNSKKYQVVHPADLFAAFQRAANETQSIGEYLTTVEEVFKSWTLNAGYPVLHVYRSENITYVKQERFAIDEEITDDVPYIIPITFTTQSKVNFNNTKPRIIMKEKELILGMFDQDWIILNVQQTGYYRVKYSEELYEYINAYMESNDWEQIHEYNRAQLVDDAFTFAEEGLMEYSTLLDIIQFLRKDKAYTPWSAAYANINNLRVTFANFYKLSKKFDAHVKNLMRTVIEYVGFENNGSELDTVFRSDTLKLACELKHEACINFAVGMFRDWVENNKSIPADFREFVYCEGLRNGTAEDYDKLFDKLLAEQVVNEGVIIMNALGCTKSKDRIKQYLQRTVQPESKTRDDDKMTIFHSVLNGNRENMGTLFDFFVTNSNDIRTSYGLDNFIVVMETIATHMSSDHLDWYESFINGANGLSSSERDAGRASLVDARETLVWVESIEDDILQWIKINSQKRANMAEQN